MVGEADAVGYTIPVGVGDTPLIALDVRRNGAARRLLIKLESHNATGSVKDRTAAGLLHALNHERVLQPGDTIIESTSGNLGIALARVARTNGYNFVAVVDPNTSPDVLLELHILGARVVMVDEPDNGGGYLLSRLQRVRELCAANPDYRWSNQYENPANPRIHETTTAPEILAQGTHELDAVFIAVSTGGTLAGVSRYLRRHAPHVDICAVDVVGSLVTGQTALPRLLTGIGASKPSAFLSETDYDRSIQVTDVEAFAACRMLAGDIGLELGGASGCGVYAAVKSMFGDAPPNLPLVLSTDGGDRYRKTFYDDAWLESKGILRQVQKTEDLMRQGDTAFAIDVREGK